MDRHKHEMKKPVGIGRGMGKITITVKNERAIKPGGDERSSGRSHKSDRGVSSEQPSHKTPSTHSHRVRRVPDPPRSTKYSPSTSVSFTGSVPPDPTNIMPRMESVTPSASMVSVTPSASMVSVSSRLPFVPVPSPPDIGDSAVPLPDSGKQTPITMSPVDPADLATSVFTPDDSLEDGELPVNTELGTTEDEPMEQRSPARPQEQVKPEKRDYVVSKGFGTKDSADSGRIQAKDRIVRTAQIAKPTIAEAEELPKSKLKEQQKRRHKDESHEKKHEDKIEKQDEKRTRLEDTLPQPYPMAMGKLTLKQAEDESSREKDQEERRWRAPVATAICSKPPPGTASEGKVTVRTNMWIMRLTPGTIVYRYQITISEESGPGGEKAKKPKTLTKGAGDDYHRQQKLIQCYQILTTMIRADPDLFGDKYAFIYDRQSCLYSQKKLKLRTENFDVKLRDGSSFVVKVEETDQKKVDLADLASSIDPLLDDKDRLTLQALDLLTSQVVFNNDRFMVFGRSFFKEPERPVNLGSGRHLMDGLQKTVRVVEGADRKSPVCVLQIDQKKTAFYKKQSVVETLKETFEQNVGGGGGFGRGGGRGGGGGGRGGYGGGGGGFGRGNGGGSFNVNQPMSTFQIRQFEANIKDVVVKAQHTERSKEFTVNGVTQESADQVSFRDQDGKSWTIAEYFEKKYGTRLKYPHLPCLIDRHPRGTNMFPIEVCEVLENQRVALKKQTEQQMRSMIRATAVAPVQRMEELKRDIDLSKVDSNKHLKACGVDISSRMMKIDARILHRPTITFSAKERRTLQPDKKGNWEQPQGENFVLAGLCSKWAIFNFDNRMDQRTMEDFAGRYEQKCKQVGVVLGKLVKMLKMEEEDCEKYFRRAGRDDYIEFLICICPDNKSKKLHDLVKLYERQYQIQTQCILSGNAKGFLGGMRKFEGILTNFVFKTNMKLGGLNLNICFKDTDPIKKWFQPGVMFMGVDVNHPPPQSVDERRRGVEPREPSVVGCVWNTRNHPFLFTGEYRYQDPRKEEVGCMRELMAQSLKRYIEDTGKESLPTSIIVYRDGVSEGQYAMVKNSECRQMYEAFMDVGGKNYKPKLTQIVVIKRHITRFFPVDADSRQKPPEQNIPCGAVIDTIIVHPLLWEFYLCSHTALQGTAKIPRYAVLVDENGFNSDDLQQVTYTLAYGHQIITKTVSMPAPCYGAHELAKRGKNLFSAISAKDGLQGSASLADELNSKLTISGTVFSQKKHWA